MKKTLAMIAASVVLLSVRTHGQKDWVYYGQDQGATRYSTLAQITTDNVTRLKRAWTFHTGDKQGFFESTRAEIQQMMEGIALGEPEIVFWRKLETHDDVGWD